MSHASGVLGGCKLLIVRLRTPEGLTFAEAAGVGDELRPLRHTSDIVPFGACRVALDQLGEVRPRDVDVVEIAVIEPMQLVQRAVLADPL